MSFTDTHVLFSPSFSCTPMSFSRESKSSIPNRSSPLSISPWVFLIIAKKCLIVTNTSDICSWKPTRLTSNIETVLSQWEYSIENTITVLNQWFVFQWPGHPRNVMRNKGAWLDTDNTTKQVLTGIQICCQQHIPNLTHSIYSVSSLHFFTIIIMFKV